MQTHSIIVIKNDKNEYLQYYDDNWNSYLFLNCKLPNVDNDKIVKDFISKNLNIRKENITISLVGKKCHNKFSERDKIQKEYTHYIYKVDLDEKLNYNEFELYDVKYKWFSYTDLMKDERIQYVNSDIIQFVKEFNM